MPASRTDSKSPRIHRREQGSPVEGGAEFDDITTSVTTSVFTEEQIKLRAMIPAITPAHGPESTSSAILAALSLGNHRPNSHTRRKSDGHVNRPPNAFIVFRRAQVQNMPANVTQHQQRISNLTALFWRVLTHSEQNTWYALSDDIKKLHSILFPDYNFNPRNPDGTKKAMLPRAGLTPERLDFAWTEAQLLIQKHTTMVQHPIAPPASSTGKLPRPKPPRKGQGTRAKERREKEAAERAAAAAQATANEAAFSDEDLAYAPEPHSNGAFDSRSYFSTIEEESSAASPNDGVIAWRPDFNLDGSVSSRSSPSANSWPELVGPLDSNAEFVDPLDQGYAPQGGYEATQHGGAVDYSMGQYTVPYTPGLIFANAGPQAASASFGPSQKHDDSFVGVNYLPATSSGPVHTYTSYYESHGPLQTSNTMHANEFMQNHSEAQYVFHDIDQTTAYLDAPIYSNGLPTEYVW
jgi:hypothetical protein